MTRIRRKIRNLYPRPPLWRSPPAPTQIVFASYSGSAPNYNIDIHFNNPVVATADNTRNIWEGNDSNFVNDISYGADGRSVSYTISTIVLPFCVGWDDAPTDIIPLGAPWLPKQVFTPP